MKKPKICSGFVKMNIMVSKGVFNIRGKGLDLEHVESTSTTILTGNWWSTRGFRGPT